MTRLTKVHALFILQDPHFLGVRRHAAPENFEFQKSNLCVLFKLNIVVAVKTDIAIVWSGENAIRM